MSNQTTLSSLSDALADAVQAAGPSIVRVRARRRLGSGVAWGPGLVVTVAGAVGRQGAARLTLNDGTEHDATVVGIDPGTDVALLRTEAPVVAGARTDGAALRVGHLVLVAGRPGRTTRATFGIVSGYSDQPWTTPLGGSVARVIEVDATLPGGFGGGALVDAQGRIVGVNSRSLVRGGITIPSDTVDAVVARLLESGTHQRGWIGVTFQGVDLVGDDAAAAAQERGLLVTGIADASPASAAGVKLGDILLRLNGRALSAWEDLAGALGGVGSPVPLDVLRAGAVTTLTVSPAERPQRRRC